MENTIQPENYKDKWNKSQFILSNFSRQKLILKKETQLVLLLEGQKPFSENLLMFHNWALPNLGEQVWRTKVNQHLIKRRKFGKRRNLNKRRLILWVNWNQKYRACLNNKFHLEERKMINWTAPSMWGKKAVESNILKKMKKTWRR